MSTLTGNKISLTYKSLIKTSDNEVLTGTLKQLSDGLGNNSGVYLNTGGDLKTTGILEFTNLKGASTAVSINKLVNEADGISNNDNDTSLPTSAAVKNYVDTHVTSQDLDFSDGTNPGAVDLDSQVFAIVGTTNEIETTASGQQLQIGLPNDVTISGTYTGTTFSGDLNGTINTATTATTQTAGDNSTKVATTAYVDTLDAASDLDFSGTTGTGDVNLNTQSLAVTGTANQITTAASNQGLEISLLSTGVTMPDGSVATTQTAGDNSTKLATTAYVDVLDAASDLDIVGDTGTGDVNLNTQSLTLEGTTNQVTTAVSGQTATFSLPSTVHRNLQGNVTGDLTGNADTATAWETARDLILSSEATGTISSVDGTQNVTGAVTLLNSAVTGKVLTGLPSPAAGNIQASDSILEAFGKVQSQINSIANGLIFKGTWDAATNTPTLTSGGGEVDSGTTDGQTAFKLIDSSQNFNTTVNVGDKVINQVDGQNALVTVIDSNTQLTLDADIMLTAEAYTIDATPFISQGEYYVVNFAGTTNLNGINVWSIGDWVIAGANNEWSKLDHSQVDGQGTPGHLPVFATATTIGDSIVSESGTALTVTGSLDTTLGASVTGDFAVNTDKFTVASASGNTAFAGDLAINTNKFTVNATSGNVDLAGNVTTGASLISTNAIVDNVVAKTSNGNITFKNNGGSTIATFNNDSSSTFAGNVIASKLSLNTTETTGKLTIESNVQSIDIFRNGSNANFDSIRFRNGDNTAVNASIGYNANQLRLNGTISTVITTGGTVGLTIDSSQNATFAGSVTVNGSQNALTINTTDIDGPYAVWKNTTNATLGFVGNANSLASAGDTNFAVRATNDLIFASGGGSERMRIDSSGNVGIGVNASDYWANANNLVVGGLGAVSGITIATDGNLIGSLIFADGTNGGDNTRGGLQYNHSTNDMLFRVDNAERMRIDGDNLTFDAGASQGNVVISIPDKQASIFNTGNRGNITIQASSSTSGTQAMSGGRVLINAGNSYNGQSGDVIISSGKNLLNAADNGSIRFNIGGRTTAEERMRITSGGHLKVSNNGSYLSATGTAHELTQTTGGDWSTIVHNATSTPYGLLVKYSSVSPNSSLAEFIFCSDSTAQRFFVTSAGAVYGNGTYGTISDKKLKENIIDATPKLDDINKLKVRNFNFKDNTEEKHIGFIAQEFEEVFPKVVETKQDKDEDNNLIVDSYTKTIKTSILIPMLVKAIQELKAEVDLLKQKCKCK